MEALDLVYGEGRVVEVGKDLDVEDRLIQGVVIEDAERFLGIDLSLNDTRKCAQLLFRRVRVTMRIEVIE